MQPDQNETGGESSSPPTVTNQAPAVAHNSDLLHDAEDLQDFKNPLDDLEMGYTSNTRPTTATDVHMTFTDNASPEISVSALNGMSNQQIDTSISKSESDGQHAQSQEVQVPKFEAFEPRKLQNQKMSLFADDLNIEQTLTQSDVLLNPYHNDNLELPILERIQKSSLGLAAQIKGKREPVANLTFLNHLIGDQKEQIQRELIELHPEQRPQAIQSCFGELGRQMIRETIITHKAYLRQIIKFIENVLWFFPAMMRELALCTVVNDLLNMNAPLFKQIINTSYGGYQANYIVGIQQHVQDINRESLKVFKQYSEDEISWRETLKEGDYIDAIMKIDARANQKSILVSQWQPAKVTICDDKGYMCVSFLYCTRKCDIKVHRDSHKIAPQNTYTDDWHWRLDIKEDTEFDCCDELGTWYKSTCLERQDNPQEVDCDGNVVPKARIACRFKDENGIKELNGIRYTGFLKVDFELTYPLAFPTIQRFGSVSTQYSNVGADNMKYYMKLEDYTDLSYPSKTMHKFATNRTECFGDLIAIADIVNQFGKRGGYEFILELLSEMETGKKEMNLGLFLQLQNFLENTMGMWQRQFLCDYVPRLEKVYSGVLFSDKANVPSLCNVDGFSSLIDNYQSLFKRYYDIDMIKKKKNYIRAYSASILITSENLQKRLQGIKMINEFIKSYRMSSNNKQQRNQLRNLKELKIFQIIFDPKTLHLQIVQRSQDIIRMYASEAEINEFEVQLLWDAAHSIDETTKIEVYKVIQECCNSMHEECKLLFLNKFEQSLPPGKVGERDLALVFQLGKSSHQNGEARRQGCKILKAIAFLESNETDRTLLKIARKNLFDLIRNYDRNTKELYIADMINIVSEHKGASVQAIKLLMKLLDTLPKYVHNVPGFSQYSSGYQIQSFNNTQSTLKEFAKDLCETQGIIDILVQDLECFLKGGILPDEGYPFLKNVKLRLDTILFFIEQVEVKNILTGTHVDHTWNLLIEADQKRGSKTESCSSLFFAFFKTVLNNQEWAITNSNLIAELFKSKILANSANLFSTGIQTEGFLCIQSLFLHTNEIMNNINIVQRQTISGTDGTSKKKLEFRVHQLPEHLIGSEALWNCFLAASVSDNTELVDLIGSFIGKLYLSLSSLVSQEAKQKAFCEFTSLCFSKMQQQFQQSLSEQQKAALVRNTMRIINAFFVSSEQVGGTASIRPHASLSKDVRLIKDLLITNHTPGVKIKYFLFTVPSNMTVWELIVFIAHKLNKSPLKIEIRSINPKVEFTGNTYCQSLADMNLQDRQELSICTPSNFVRQVPLINFMSHELVREAQEIFISWFNKYSIPREDIDPEFLQQSTPADRYMTKETAVNWLTEVLQDQRNTPKRLINNASLSAAEDKRVNSLFSDFDHDDDQMLTEKDFIEFYTQKSIKSPDTVWQNLRVAGYGNDLMPENNQEIQFDNDPRVTKHQNELPRCLISNDQQFLQKLLSINVDQAQEQVWDLISSLKTNSDLLGLMVQGFVDLTPGQSDLNLLYQLQILEHLIEQGFSTQNLAEQAKCKIYNEQAKQRTQIGNNNQDFPDMQNSWGNNNAGQQDEERRENDMDMKGGSQSAQKSNKDTSNIAIPLPPKEDVEADQNKRKRPNSAQNQNDGAGGSNSKTNDKNAAAVTFSYNFQQISKWEGQINEVIVPQTSEQIPENSIDQWLLKFLIEQKGFEKLVAILKHYLQLETSEWSSFQQNCIKISCKLIKTILMCTLKANSQDKALMTSLTRRISSSGPEELKMNNNDSKQASDPQNNTNSKQLVNQQEELANQYDMMVTILLTNGFQLSQLLVQDQNMENFTQVILNYLPRILNGQSFQKGNTKEDERVILQECLNIWLSLITFYGDYLSILYNNENLQRLLLEQGLLSGAGQSIRSSFQEVMSFIARYIKQDTLSIAPSIFILRSILLKQYQAVIQNANASNTQQYFALTSELIVSHYKMREKAGFDQLRDTSNVTEQIDFRHLIMSLCDILNNYKSIESRYIPDLVDHTLVGLLNLICTLLNLDSQLLNENEKSQVLSVIVLKCLFSQAAVNYEGHILPDVDIRALKSVNDNKCHTSDSRNAAYVLFQTIIQMSKDPQIAQQLMSTFWGPQISKLEKPSSDMNPQYAMQPFSLNQQKFTGIRNLGCICYMNAMLQQFYHVPTFRYCLLAAGDKQADQIITKEDGRKLDDNLLHQWLNMFSSLELTDRYDYNSQDFCYAFKTMGQPTNVRVQQDAQEFLNIAFDRLENSLKETPMKYLCQSVFQGKSASLVVCKNCGHIKQNDEDFYCLSIQVKDQKTIYKGLQNLVAGETIQDYKCSNCEQTVEIEKKMAVKSLPNTLILHLNRIIFDMDKFKNVKLNDKCEFPTTLDMQEFMLEQVIKGNKKTGGNDANQDNNIVKDDEEPNEMNEQEVDERMEVDEQNEEVSKNEFEYKLVGVVVHMGIADAGHYLSYINIDRSEDAQSNPHWMKTENQTWLEFNDSKVERFDFNQLEFKCFGETPSKYQNSNFNNMNYHNTDDQSKITAQQAHNAYMLIYEKREKVDIKVFVDDEILSQAHQLQENSTVNQLINSSALACDSTAIPSANQNDLAHKSQSHHAFHAIPSLSQYIVDQQFEKTNLISSAQDLSLNVPSEQQHSEMMDSETQAQNNNEGKGKAEDQAEKQPQERIVNIPFFDAQKFIPNAYYIKVDLDNQLHLAEQQVYSDAFFQTTYSLLQRVVEQNISQSDNQRNEAELQQVDQQSLNSVEDCFNMLDKIIFDLLMNVQENKCLPQMVNLLMRLCETQPSLLIQLIERRILVEEIKNQNSKNETKERPFFEMLIFHREQEVRETAELILTRVTKILFGYLRNASQVGSQKEQMIESDIEKIQNTLNQLITYALDLMPMEAQKVWHKLGAYFNYFWNLVEDNQVDQMRFLCRKQLISKLVDLLSRFKDHQQMGFAYQAPPLDNAVKTIARLARSQPLLIWLYQIPNQHQVTLDELLQEMRNGNSPYWLHASNQNDQFLVEQKSLYLDAEDMRALSMEDKRLRAFWDLSLKMIQCQDSREELALLIGHCSYKNYDFSRKICKELLQVINNTQYHDLAPFRSMFQVVLTVPDEFMNMRIEWFLGFPEIEMQQPIYMTNNYRHSSHKIGMGKIGEITDNVYKYTTSLIKQASTSQEPMLQMIYNYRKTSFQEAAMFQLDMLLQAVVAHPQTAGQSIMNYLLKIEGPAYTSRRYWDWIEPFIISQIEDQYNGNLNNVSENLSTSWFSIHTNIGKINQLFEGLIKSVAGPEPYLTWSIDENKDLITQEFQTKYCHVVASEFQCEISKSKPDPVTATNACVTQVYRSQWGFSKNKFMQVKQSKVSSSNRQKNQPRGRSHGKGRGKNGKNPRQWKYQERKTKNLNDAGGVPAFNIEDPKTSHPLDNATFVTDDSDLRQQTEQMSKLNVANNSSANDDVGTAAGVPQNDSSKAEFEMQNANEFTLNNKLDYDDTAPEKQPGATTIYNEDLNMDKIIADYDQQLYSDDNPLLTEGLTSNMQANIQITSQPQQYKPEEFDSTHQEPVQSPETNKEPQHSGNLNDQQQDQQDDLQLNLDEIEGAGDTNMSFNAEYVDTEESDDKNKAAQPASEQPHGPSSGDGIAPSSSDGNMPLPEMSNPYEREARHQHEDTWENDENDEIEVGLYDANYGGAHGTGGAGGIMDQDDDDGNNDHQYYYDEEDDEQPQESQEQEDDEKYSSATILMFTLRNFSHHKHQTFTIRFDQSKAGICNFNFPECDQRIRVSTKTDHSYLKLTKLRPNEPWGDISFDFLIDDENQDGINCKYYRNYSHLRLPRAQMMAQEAAAYEAQMRNNSNNQHAQNNIMGGSYGNASMGANMYGSGNMQNNDILHDSGSNDFMGDDGRGLSDYGNGNGAGSGYDVDFGSGVNIESGSGGGIVECQMCTFHNPPGSRECSMCCNPL